MAAPATTTAPTTAERIRSTCARAGGAMLAIEGVEPIASAVHHLLDDGSVAVSVPVEGAAWCSQQAPPVFPRCSR